MYINYRSKGNAIYKEFEEDGNTYYDISFEDDFEMLNVINDRYEGMDFLKSVKSLGFMDCDGWVDEVFINGYKSNIRLCAYGIDLYKEDKFINFGEEAWIDLCENFDVEVYWVNK